MPRILITSSTHPDLITHVPYTLIIRKHGLIFKKLDNNEDRNLDFVFMLKIQPEQVNKLELLTNIDETVILSMEFRIDKIKYSFTYNSLELPVSVLYEKLMKIIDPLYEEKSINAEELDINVEIKETKLMIQREPQQNAFLHSIDGFLKSAENIIRKGISVISSGINSIQHSISSIFSQSNESDPLLAENMISMEDIQEDIEYNEMLTFVNKIHLNYIDTAYFAKEDSDNFEIDKKGKIFANKNVQCSNEILKRSIMLFIPPFGCDLHIYKDFYGYFSHKYRIIAFDQRGFGGSEQHKNDNYKFSDYIKDLNEFLEAKINESVENNSLVIISSSITGLMLLHNISNLNFPKSNIKIILLSSSDKFDESLQAVIKNLPHPKTWGILKRTGKGKAKKLIFSPETQENIKEFILNNLFQSDHRVAYETLKNLTSKEYIKGLSENNFNTQNQTQIKILLINGENDIIFDQEKVISLSRYLPNSSLALIKGNHFFMFENPIPVIIIIEKWLKNVSGGI